MKLELLLRSPPHLLLASVCAGLAAANVIRGPLDVALALACALALLAATSAQHARIALIGLALAVAGWGWGSARLHALDRSVLRTQVDRAEHAVVVATGPARRTRFALRLPVEVRRFGRLLVGEPSLLELPLGRSPPQGAVLDVLAEVKLPRPARHGFDERRWLRRHGVHVVLHGDRWRIVGRRGGLGGIADRLRARLSRSIAPGLHGERRAILAGVVLGDDAALSDDLRRQFRVSGLYHLLAVSGQNVALVAGGALMAAWAFGAPRWLGELGALAAIFAYVLAVGAQPSVVRAGIAGALGSLAWLTARARDRWYFLLLGALGLLAWNPYVVFDPGFQLSFSAVVAIFVAAPRVRSWLEGYPLPASVRTPVAISTACGVVTAPILWLQFKAIPLLAVPANVLAAPAIPLLLGLAFATAALDLVSPPAASALAWLNGLDALYLGVCARLVAALPFAQLRSGLALGLLGALAVGAYAWRRCPS